MKETENRRATWIEIIRHRIGLNLDRAGFTGNRRATLLETEVAAAIAETNNQEPVTDDGFLDDDIPVDTPEETAAPVRPARKRQRKPFN